MRLHALALVALALVALVAGCGATEDQLRARVAFDMKCPQNQVHITEIDSRTRGVDACGQRATYVESCNGPKSSMSAECTWVMNSTSPP